MIKAIIFDYDGVIVDSFPSVFEVYKKIFKHFNVKSPDNLDDFRKIYGHSYVECLKNLGIEGEDKLNEASEIYCEEIIKMKHDVFDDVVDVIKETAKKYKLFLVSASYNKEILPKIEKFGLTDCFEKIYCGTEHRARKSEMMKNLLAEQNYSLSEIVCIGDRAIDYEAAKKVGIADGNIILVNYGGWGLDQGKIGDSNIAENPKEILRLIEKIDQKLL